MTRDEVLLPSSLTKLYIEIQIQNDLTRWRVQALGRKQNSQLQFPAHTVIWTLLHRVDPPTWKIISRKKKTKTTPTFFPVLCALKLPIMTTIKFINAEAQTISNIPENAAACFVAEVIHFLQHLVRIDASTHLEIFLSIFSSTLFRL